ncbi:MAG: peptidoglycan DD-metalloendopeptidase family protein [Eubacteriaceae bacterium]|nr:peptidoglycan DD-metalloendopeptidase family protein [Eubacteriaceae bacterium]
MELKFKLQRNEEAQLQKLFARYQRRQNRKHIAEEKIEITKAQKEAIQATMSYKKTGTLQIGTTAAAVADKRPIMKIASKAAYQVQKGAFSIQSTFLYIYYSLLDMIDSVKQSKALYIVCAMLIVMSTTMAGIVNYVYGYEVILNGYNIGYVRNISTFNEALSRADAQFRQWYQNDSVFYERTITKISTFIGNKPSELLDVDGCLKKIYECNIPIFAQGGVIEIDGIEAVRLASIAEANDTVSHLSARSEDDEDFISTEIIEQNPIQDISVSPKTVEMTSVASVQEAIEYLLDPEDSNNTRRNSTLVDRIANTNDSGNRGMMTALNFRQDDFAVGDIASKPKVTFNTVKMVKYEEEIKFSKEYKNDSSLLEGQTKVVQDGVNGIEQVEAVIKYANNKEISREVKARNITTYPVNQVIARGTKPIPVVYDGTGSGDYIIPGSGKISSFTASRSGSHANYNAIDIALPVGSSIVASKNGTVTMAEYYGDYGYCVQIKHSDNYSTLYAHLDSFTCKVGDTVKQGDQVARSGNTGRTTGPHLHFEIRKNGTRLDLRNFFDVKEGQTIKAGLKSK